MNFADSEMMKNILEGSGFAYTEKPEEADLIIFNSCSVRAHAEDRLFSNIGLFIKKYPQAKFILAGCTAKRFCQSVFKKFPKIDAVLSPAEISAISDIVEDIFEGRKVVACGEREYPLLKRKGRMSEYVVIQTGCDNFCSYCVVPFLRGREKCRPPEEILEEVRSIAEGGTKEVVLLGQNVNSYRGDGKISDFADLLERVSEIPGILRIRFLTSHPKDIPDKLIDVMAANKKIARHIHLPVQSGSDRILHLMNRNYTSGKYLETLEKIRNKIPDVVVTTDIICGFPTESEKDFADTVKLVEKAQFAGIFSFKYSPREETAAYKMTDDVPQKTKEERLKDIQNLAVKYAFSERKKFVGKKVEVLFEKDGVGHSSQNFLVLKQNAKAGEFLEVKIRKASRWRLFG